MYVYSSSRYKMLSVDACMNHDDKAEKLLGVICNLLLENEEIIDSFEFDSVKFQSVLNSVLDKLENVEDDSHFSTLGRLILIAINKGSSDLFDAIVVESIELVPKLDRNTLFLMSLVFIVRSISNFEICFSYFIYEKDPVIEESKLKEFINKFEFKSYQPWLIIDYLKSANLLNLSSGNNALQDPFIGFNDKISHFYKVKSNKVRDKEECRQLMPSLVYITDFCCKYKLYGASFDLIFEVISVVFLGCFFKDLTLIDLIKSKEESYKTKEQRRNEDLKQN